MGRDIEMDLYVSLTGETYRDKVKRHYRSRDKQRKEEFYDQI